MLNIRAKIRGLTLIELLIAMVIMGFLLMMGVPSYTRWIGNTKIRTAGDSILNGMQLARAEAVHRSSPVQFAMTALPMADWTVSTVRTGTTVQSYTSAEGVTTTRITATPAGATTVTFNALGQVTTNNDGSAAITQLDITSTSAAADRPLRIIIISGGSPKMCDPQVAAGDPRACS